MSFRDTANDPSPGQLLQGTSHILYSSSIAKLMLSIPPRSHPVYVQPLAYVGASCIRGLDWSPLMAAEIL